MTRKNNAWNDGTVRVVGSFFEDLTLALIGGELVWSKCGDIEVWDTHAGGVGVEVKGADDRHEFLVGEDQLRDHLDVLPFPMDHSCYWLYTYHNKVLRKDNGKRTTALRANDTLAGKRFHVGENVVHLFVVDTALLDMWRSHFPIRTIRHPSDERGRALGCNRRVLKQLIGELPRNNGHAVHNPMIEFMYSNTKPQLSLFNTSPTAHRIKIATSIVTSHELADALLERMEANGAKIR